jgi:hypothetical protein
LVDGCTQGGLEIPTLLRLPIELRLENPKPAASIRFGAIHRQVRGSEQLSGILIVAVCDSNAYAGANNQTLVVNAKGCSNKFNQTRRERRGFFRLLIAKLNDRKFIATKSPNLVAFPESISQAARQVLEHGISSPVPEGVIDILEAIQINEQNRQITTVMLPVHKRIAKLLVEQQPIAKARQRIVVRQVRDHRLRFFALLDFASKLLIGLNQVLCARGNTALECLVCSGKLLVHLLNLLFCSLSIELSDYAG